MKRLSKTLDNMAEVATTPSQYGLLKDCAERARDLEWQEDVRDFHAKFGHQIRDTPDSRADSGWWTFRQNLIEEEVWELIDALDSRKLGDIAQECVDVIVVVLGTAVGLGIRLAPIWRAVMRANMRKEPNPKGSHLKPIKNEGWTKPDYARLVANQIPPKS